MKIYNNWKKEFEIKHTQVFQMKGNEEMKQQKTDHIRNKKHKLEIKIKEKKEHWNRMKH